jgi:Carbohydrate binding module (family 6)
MSRKYYNCIRTEILAMLLSTTIGISSTALAYSPDHAILGWDGDKDAVFAYMTGGYHIRDTKNIDVSFGIYDNVTHSAQTVQWYNESGYLPCLTTQFERDNCTVKISNFGDKVTIGGNDYVAIYSRVSIYNHDTQLHALCPLPSTAKLVSLTSRNCATQIQVGQTVYDDYVIAVDRFGNSYPWPSDVALANAGDWNTHYAHMATYWNNKLAGIVNITQLPDPTLIKAYKAGYIYTHIVKDGYALNTGEDNYDSIFDHDAIGILANLLSLGDFTDAQIFLPNLHLLDADAEDAKFKYPWPWAIYLEKTGDTAFVSSHFTDIMTAAHLISTDRTGPGGIMEFTWTVDNWGYWTVDNWSALMGLAAYQFICNKLGNTVEETWAANEYNSLLAAVNTTLQETMNSFAIGYTPLSILESNILRDPKDASWASMCQFGRWGWDAYLFGASQSGVSLYNIDYTYDAGFLGGWAAGLPQHDFGGFPGFSSVYNAGSASGALRGERYRSEGIYAYQFMIGYGQTGPFCWHESFREPVTTSPWIGQHPSGSYYVDDCPHMWGQANATKVLIDSLIAEKTDGSVIIGRGVPNAWAVNGNVVELSNFPIANNNRMGFKLEGGASNHTNGLQQGQVRLTLTGTTPSGGAVLDLRAFLGNIGSVTAGTIDNVNGTVTLGPGITTTTVTLVNPNPTPIPTPTPLPSPSPPPIGGSLREAESGVRNGCYLQADANASGGYRIDGLDANGDYVSLTGFPAATRIKIRYASPNSGTFGLYVNGGRAASIPITSTGPAPGGWNTYAESAVNVSIPANATVKFQKDAADVAINLDYSITGLIEMESGALTGGATDWPDYYASAGHSVLIDSASDTVSLTNFPATNQLALRYSTYDYNTTTTINLSVNGGPPQTITLPHNRGGGGSAYAYTDQVVGVNIPAGAVVSFQGVTGAALYDCISLAKKVEAENATLTGCYIAPDAYASNGYRVDGIDAIGDNVKFTGVQGGSHIAIRYATIYSGPMSLYINGEHRAHIFFLSTGSWGGTPTSFQDKVLGIYTPPNGEVKLQFDSGDVPVNLDYIRIY